MKQLRVNKITEYLEAKKNFDGVERLTTIHEFVQNKSWMDNQVGDGKKVLVGRIGGHPY